MGRTTVMEAARLMVVKIHPMVAIRMQHMVAIKMARMVAIKVALLMVDSKAKELTARIHTAVVAPMEDLLMDNLRTQQV